LKGEELKVVVGRDACEKNTYRRLTVLIRHHGPKLLGLLLTKRGLTKKRWGQYRIDCLLGLVGIIQSVV
jgi:hypothetical protein